MCNMHSKLRHWMQTQSFCRSLFSGTIGRNLCLESIKRFKFTPPELLRSRNAHPVIFHNSLLDMVPRGSSSMKTFDINLLQIKMAPYCCTSCTVSHYSNYNSDEQLRSSSISLFVLVFVIEKSWSFWMVDGTHLRISVNVSNSLSSVLVFEVFIQLVEFPLCTIQIKELRTIHNGKRSVRSPCFTLYSTESFDMCLNFLLHCN